MKSDLLKVKQNLEKLKDTSGKKAKVSVLKEITQDVSTDYVVRFLLNTYITTGLKLAKLEKDLPPVDADVFITMEEMLRYVEKNNTGSNHVVSTIKTQVRNNSLNEEETEFLFSILSKKFKMGLSADTYNSNIISDKGLIPTFAVQLAQTYDETTHKWLEGEIAKGKSFTLTNKYNGNRCITFVEDGTVSHYSRAGNPILGMELLEDDFKFLPEGFVYESEITKDLSVTTDLDEAFRQVNGEVNSKGTNKDVHCQIFDMLPIEEFKVGLSSKTYIERREQLDTTVPMHHGRIHNAPVLYSGNDIEMIKVILLEQNEKGEEGTMVQLNEGLYHNKRTRDLLKAKTFYSADLIIIGFEEGQNKYKGTLGTIVVDYKGSPLGISGMSDKERDDVWNNKDKYLNKIIEISYQGESRNKKTGNLSLQFATFVAFRWDKTEPSYEI